MASQSILRPPAMAGIGPGLLASLIIAAAAAFLADHYGGPVMLFALLLGMAMNFLSEVDRCRPGVEFASEAVLRLGVAMLGFRITIGRNRRARLEAGCAGHCRRDADNPGIDLAGAARWASGPSSACCPAAPRRSAARRRRHGDFRRAAARPAEGTQHAVHHHRRFDAVDAGDDHLSGADRSCSPRRSCTAGMFIGATVHDVAQVVGAGYAISPEAGDTATVVKLMRVAMLLPVIVATTMLMRGQGGRRGRAAADPALVPGGLSGAGRGEQPVARPGVCPGGRRDGVALVPGDGDRRARHQDAVQGHARHRLEAGRADGRRDAVHRRLWRWSRSPPAGCDNRAAPSVGRLRLMATRRPAFTGSTRR